MHNKLMELANEISRQILKVLTTFFYLFMIRYRDELKEELFNFQTEFKGNIEDSGFKGFENSSIFHP